MNHSPATPGDQPPFASFTHLPAGPYRDSIDRLAALMADEVLDELRGLESAVIVTDDCSQCALCNAQRDAVAATRNADVHRLAETIQAAEDRAIRLVSRVAREFRQIEAADCPDCGGRWSVRPGLAADLVAVVCRRCGHHVGDFAEEAATR